MVVYRKIGTNYYLIEGMASHVTIERDQGLKDLLPIPSFADNQTI